MDSQQFTHGDHVYVGKPGPNKVHWIYWSPAHESGIALLKSPMSGRLRREPLANLTLHSRKDAA